MRAARSTFTTGASRPERSLPDLPPWAVARLPPPAIARGRALLGVAVVVGILYAIIYGGAALAGTEKRFEHPLLGVSIETVLMSLLVAAFSIRDPQWRQSLSVEKKPWQEWVLFGGVGMATIYGANLLVGGLYVVITRLSGGDLTSLTQSKAQWTMQLADIPVPAMLLLAVLAGAWEELVFRGFLLGRLRVLFRQDDPLRRDLSAVLVTGLIFGFGHGYQGAFGLVQTSMVGIVLGLLVLWRGSLWPAVFAHAGIDGISLVALKVLKPMLEKALKGELPTS